MILTVTPNTALDRVLFVDRFDFGETVRAGDAAEILGGKGCIASSVLGQLGTPSLATGLAAGTTGRRMEAMLKAAGVQTDFYWVEGETRSNTILVRIADGAQGTVTVPGLYITPEDACRFREHVFALLDRADCLLCAGSLPRGMPLDWYTPLIRRAKEKGILTLLDTSDQFLAPSLAAAPDIIKPNAAEATMLAGWPVCTVDDAIRCVRELRNREVLMPIVTLGERGAVAGTGEGILVISPLQVRAVKTAGAGDAFNAGLLQARSRGADWEEALRWAAAVATATLLCSSTGICRPEDVQRLYAQVCVERV